MRMQRNARICTAFFPLWAVPYTLYNYYLSLFLLQKGVTEAQLALLMSAANISALVFALIASPIVDTLGRKRSTFIFDMLSSALPPLIFFLTQSFAGALVAMALAGMNRIMSVGYYLLMIEDADEANSIASMNAFNLILVASGLATSIGGLAVARYGLIKSEMAFLLISFISMTALDIARNALVKETPTGLALMGQRSRIDLVGSYRQTLKYLASSPKAIRALAVNALIYVYYTIGTSISLYFTPYFSIHAGLSGAKLGLVGAVYAIGTLAAMIFINPRITHKSIYGFTVGFAAASIAGFALLMSCPKGNDIMLFSSLLVIAVSYGVLKSSADSLLAIETDGPQRSGVYSLSFVVSSVLSIIAIQAVQALYQISPVWLFGSSAVLMALVIAVCLISKERKNA